METRKKFLDREIVQNVSGSATASAAPAHNVTCESDRRVFLSTCSAALVVAASQFTAVSASHAAPGVAVKRYAGSILADEYGQPVLARTLKPLTNYLFHYPFLATPCLLIDLGRDVGGVGRAKSIVAFSAICSHKLAYPAKEVSFIRFQANASTRSEAQRIHCCADHSVYDPAAGAKVVAGPAPAALAVVLLEHDRKADTLRAVGVSGVEQFSAFFAKYEFKLGMEFGGRAANLSGSNTRLQELTQFCRNIAQC